VTIIQAIAQVESGGKVVAGDKGAALSMYQIHRAAWLDVRDHKLRSAPAELLDIGEHYEDIGADSAEGRLRAENCAVLYELILADRLTRAGAMPTAANIYACWNLGFEGFKQRHFDILQCPKRTMDNARRVAILVKLSKRNEQI
jgi:hypothetical protein